jgi:hypothetical protein
VLSDNEAAPSFFDEVDIENSQATRYHDLIDVDNHSEDRVNSVAL